MPLFGRQNTAQTDRQARSREQLERGGLPLDAEMRLRGLHGRAGFFTSNLSVNEFVLAATEGVRPLGQVMGSSVYHIGWQFTPTYASGELTTLSHAQYHARLLALSRLQQEARLLGAHGVIGVRLERQAYDWGENLLEFMARGTAVALEGEAVPAAPFVCALSAQEFWALRRAGYRPVGFAFGTCVYYHVATFGTQWATQGGWLGTGALVNMELTDYTQAVYTTRYAAMTRLTEEAARVGAGGVVGVTVENSIQPYEVEINNQQRRDLITHFTALGTAVTEQPGEWPAFDYALPLTD